MLTFVVLFVTACGSKGVTGENNKNDKKVLRFATWDSGETLKIQQNIAKEFEKANPNVKVQVEAYGDGFDQKLAASFGAKNPPDVMYMWDFSTYHQSLEPLGPFIKKDKDINMDDFYPGLFNYSSVNGEVYGMPAGFTTMVVYYNKKLFDQYKIPYPTSGWTWDDFKTIAKKLTDKKKKQYGFGVSSEPDTYDLQGLIWSNGGSYVSDDGKEINGYMNSPETIDALQMYSNMVKDGIAVLVGGKNQQSGSDIFKSGKLGMYISGIWPLDGFKNAGIDVGTAVIPGFGSKPIKGLIASSAVSIAKDSKQKDLAWKFVKFYSSEKAIKMRKADLPVRKSVVEETKITEDELYKPFYTMLENSSNTPAFLLNSNWNEINRNLSAAINAIMLGDDAKKLLNQAVKDSEKYVKK
ncbi:sugar ABC transporter substrate-binding protein [Bacillus sp. RG28]|uniref:Sugar ABC transporter substrate-binding protein n=1 Tax=Gottfriedia endophytica TaxID=2820819 RepID=A0A940NQP7_9BACI|nr:sugar ABC transporter substrate-binding protein [Gottfriedia endophytica]MBP0726524.1 sugar ABC transporter substrate-binding protein [Gottfriedia endophytica]